MKKISLYALAGAVALSAVSCTDDYTDWAGAQTNPQENAVEIPGFTSAALGGVIDLATVTTDSVNLFTLAANTLPAGYSLENIRVEVAAGQSPAVTLGSDVYGRVEKTALQTVVMEAYGRRPTARQMAVQVYADAVRNGEAVLIDAGEVEAKVTPAAPFIDEAYYLVGDMFADGWTATGMMKFDHSGKDVYDDSKFSVVFKTTAADQLWQITTQTNAGNPGGLLAEGKTGLLGTVTDGDVATEGALTTASPGKGKIGKPGIYRLTIDMWNYTYTIEELNFTPYIYEVGSNTSWGDGTPCPLAGVDYDGKYRGFAYLDGEFKFKPNADNWDGDLEKLSGDAYSGTLDENGPGNIDAPEPGFYMMEVDLAAMTYKNTLISTIGVIGDATPGGWDTDTNMTYDASDNSWNVTVDLTDGLIKFRADHKWDINWGGSADELLFNSGNMSVKAGKYVIKLKLSCDGKNVCEMVRK